MTPAAARPGRAAGAIVGLLVIWCAGFIAPDLHLALLYLAPALLLATALLAGRYPGERVLERIAVRRRPRRRAAARSSGQRPRRACVRVAAGGLLLARALAGRAPPCSRRTATSR